MERAKKCLDFAATLYVLHLTMCMVYSGFSRNLAWCVTCASQLPPSLVRWCRLPASPPVAAPHRRCDLAVFDVVQVGCELGGSRRHCHPGRMAVPAAGDERYRDRCARCGRSYHARRMSPLSYHPKLASHTWWALRGLAFRIVELQGLIMAVWPKAVGRGGASLHMAVPHMGTF